MQTIKFVEAGSSYTRGALADKKQQEMMNFWKQSNHVMSYFKEENFRAEKRLPTSFMSGFLEVRQTINLS